MTPTRNIPHIGTLYVRWRTECGHPQVIACGIHPDPAANSEGTHRPEFCTTSQQKKGGTRQMAKETDPVCGMQIERDDAAGESGFEGRTYYFCSSSCKKEFDADPARFESKSENQ